MARLRVTGDRAWAVYLAAGLLMITAYYATMLAGVHVSISVALYLLVSASSAVAVLEGCRRHRPRPLLPWSLLGLSAVVYAAADISFYTSHVILGHTEFPALADVLYLSHYPLVVAGLLALIRLRTPGGDLPSLLDAAVVAVVAGMLSWLYLIVPYTHEHIPALATVTSVGYPMMDLAMFAVALRLVLGRGRRPMSFYLLSTNLLALLTADSVYVTQQLTGSYAAGNFLDAIWLFGNLALGAAALHPTMTGIGEPAPVELSGAGAGRAATTGVAALIAPATLLVRYAQGSYEDVPVVGVACAVLFGLTSARLVRLVAEQRQLAITDALTGLRTRRFFEASLPEAIARARKAAHSTTVLLVDVDRFKSINDKYGHPVGDRVLIAIAAQLRRTVGAGGVLARYGGEEFAALIPGAEPQAGATLAERLRKEIAVEPIRLPGGRHVSATISVGAASYPADGHTPQDLISTADHALYRAKADGRNRAVAGSADPDAEGSFERVPDLSGALDYFEHVADVVDGWVAAEEHSGAVARWARLVAEELGLGPASTHRAELGGRLHDIGKVLIGEDIWSKRTPLTEFEKERIRRHPEDGYQIVRTVPDLMEVAVVIRQHHERFDGTGYPQGLAGSEITIEARIVSVCDSWAAMLANRSYHRALSEDEAKQELLRCRNTQFDPAVVEMFLRLHECGRLGALDHPPRRGTSGQRPTLNDTDSR